MEREFCSVANFGSGFCKSLLSLVLICIDDDDKELSMATKWKRSDVCRRDGYLSNRQYLVWQECWSVSVVLEEIVFEAILTSMTKWSYFSLRWGNYRRVLNIFMTFRYQPISLGKGWRAPSNDSLITIIVQVFEFFKNHNFYFEKHVFAG